MRWFRSHKQAWGWVSLFALVLQLGLSFGHVHGTHSERLADAFKSVAGIAPRTVIKRNDETWIDGLKLGGGFAQDEDDEDDDD